MNLRDTTLVRRWIRRAILAGAAVAGLLVLYVYPPGAGSLYPRCLIHAVTGLSCPGCGTLRALHALLHGRLAEALGWNAWSMAVLAVLAVYGVLRASAFRWSPRRPAVRFPVSLAGVLALSGLVFCVLRNAG